MGEQPSFDRRCVECQAEGQAVPRPCSQLRNEPGRGGQGKGRARRWEVLTSAVPARRCPGCGIGRLSGESQVGGHRTLLLTGLRPGASLPDLQALACTRSPSVLKAPQGQPQVFMAWEQGESMEWTGWPWAGTLPPRHHWNFPDLQENHAGEAGRGEAEEWRGSCSSPCGSCGCLVGRNPAQRPTDSSVLLQGGLWPFPPLGLRL